MKNENVHYFRLPKLGCYLAIPLVYNSYLTEHIFDVALGAKLKDIAAEKEFNKTKHDNLQEAEHEITELEKKLF